MTFTKSELQAKEDMAEGPVLKPSEPEPEPEPPSESPWKDAWVVLRTAIIAVGVDVIALTLFLVGLLTGYALLKLSQVVGYSNERLARIDLIYYWAYFICVGIFVTALVCKSVLLLLETIITKVKTVRSLLKGIARKNS